MYIYFPYLFSLILLSTQQSTLFSTNWLCFKNVLKLIAHLRHSRNSVRARKKEADFYEAVFVLACLWSNVYAWARAVALKRRTQLRSGDALGKKNVSINIRLYCTDKLLDVGRPSFVNKTRNKFCMWINIQFRRYGINCTKVQRK